MVGLHFTFIDKDQRITELSLTLSEREDKYKRLLKDFEELKNQVDKETSMESGLHKMIEEKEEELEKINYMNASYRAQLIELKISMAKTRDATIGKNKENEQYVVKINTPEEALEEAKENINIKEAKIQEQNSIIETLIAQVKYYEQQKK
jgi:chromosome segregation ATPase